jgi:hypothetical protein
MSPPINATDIASMIGAGLAGVAITGGVFVRYALPWFKERDRDVASIKTEVGVGSVGPSIVELVAGTAAVVQRLEQSSTRNGEGISQVLHVQAEHGERITAIELKHRTLTEEVAAALAAKTGEIARTLSDKTEKIAAELKKKADLDHCKFDRTVVPLAAKKRANK